MQTAVLRSARKAIALGQAWAAEAGTREGGSACRRDLSGPILFSSVVSRQ
jgi:hypothetical protein